MSKSAQNKTNPKIKINMLHPQGEALNISGNFLKWLVSYGRYIIIVAEIFVLGCFLYQFGLEAENKNLNDQITTVSEKIQSQSTQEKMIDQVHTKLNQIQQTLNADPEWKQVYNEIASLTPQTVTLTEINFTHSQTNSTINFKISASTKITSDIGAFLNSLRQNNSSASKKYFANINLEGVTYDQGKLTFTISGNTQ